MINKIIKYIRKQFNINEKFNTIPALRKPMKIKTSQVLWIWLFIAFLRISSLNEWEYSWQEGKLKKLRKKLGWGEMSADSVGEVIKRIKPLELEIIIVHTVKNAYRKKMLNSKWTGWWIILIDGTETHEVEHCSCPYCLTRTHKKEDGTEVTRYYHKYVKALLLCKEHEQILGIERVNPGEDERGASKRLVKRLKKNYPFLGEKTIVVADALYAVAPFKKVVKELQWHMIFRLKNERRDDFKYAKALFAKENPKKIINKNRYQLSLWDMEENCPVGLDGRIVQWKEEKKARHRKAGKWYEQIEKFEGLAITDLSPTELFVEQVVEIMRARWDIENKAFRDLKTNWHEKHYYIHCPHTDKDIYDGILNLFLLFALAFNLWSLFIERHLRTDGKTWLQWAEDLLVSIMELQNNKIRTYFDTS